MKKKPNLSLAQIWNMSFGFLGIQMGFALQNGNGSRILLNFGADVEELGWFWLVAPLTGLIVQPIIGHYSDHTWTKLGRRRPFFLAGAIVASLGLFLLPNADMFTKYLPALWVGAGFIMIMDASFNVAMEPFRALVGDKLNSEQRTQGFSIQTVLIGIGAVVGSWLPYALKNWFGMADTSVGSVPSNVVWSFIIGGICLLGAIIWTVIKTTEYSPEETASFEIETPQEEIKKAKITDIFTDFGNMPSTMKQLGLVQFFSWFGLFLMWVYSTPAIAQHIYNLPIDDRSSSIFNEAGDWVGILFGVYNGVSAIYAFFLPRIAEKIGRKQTHSISLLIGALGLISIYFIPSPNFLIISMIGIGIAWASILAMPYAILGGSIPARKMGIYMGIFNFFITLPQIASAVFSGKILTAFMGNHAINLIMLAGVCFIIAAIAVRFVDDKDEVVGV
ncbi:maltose/moltooligosaccharide transporter [Spirosomataceae bacterium TFI 002]|nr:maltose/moltooligosaccharide transporter [Spirosomataceae bacterium TFI 002]